MTPQLWLADLILLAHAGIIAYAVFLPFLVMLGAPLRWRWVRLRWPRMLHLGLMVFVTTQAVLGELCPLTEWEHDLRIAAGGTGYGEQGLLADLLHRVLFFSLPNWAFAVLYGAYAAFVAATFWWVPVPGPKQPEN